MQPAIRPLANLGKRDGFTLLEMAVVLTIVGVLTGMTAYFGVGMVDNARKTQTQVKLDRLERALAAYRDQNGTLPCPADLAITPGAANYGVMAAPPGDCTTGVPAATYNATLAGAHKVVEGMVPFQTMGLNEDDAYDAWGHRFFYAVDTAMTQYDSFKNYTIYDQCQALQVQDPTGAARTSTPNGALYVLVSTGPDGQGGFTHNGTRDSSGLNSDPATMLNCHCNASGVATAYTAQYMQKEPTRTFDDLVRFKERWQLQTPEDARTPLYMGPEVGFAQTSAPYLTLYSRKCDTYTQLTAVSVPPAPAVFPGGAANAISISPDNQYWAVGYNSLTPLPYLTIYKRDTNTGQLGALLSPLGLSAALGGNALSVAFSTSGVYLAAGQGGVTHLSIYKDGGGDVFNLLSGGDGPQSQPPQPIKAVAFSVSDTYLATLDTSNALLIYTRTQGTDTFTAPTGDTPTGNIQAIAFSPNGQYFAAAYNGSLKLFSMDYNGCSTCFTAFETANGIGSPSGVQFSGDSLIVAVSTNSGIRPYRIDASQPPGSRLSALTILNTGTSYNNLVFSQRINSMAAVGGLVSTMFQFTPAQATSVFTAQPGTMAPGNQGALRY